ncbi:response regulator transcription factor [Spirosoma endophyticum]|uniref:DNA-binding response regulator, OmpR family, contains REC and winged-helix (WHTH) domain n=1 Tax=Spirosoma endophyticum TaxID=662367 RepID=A0A1I1HHS7_9BACT|nr:response regulator transcription factor [Spirosoma endophyticum]SFC21023.1 DNA-binding response regulator, OmpR family, contains REC and winged-helix (wHTH) domain [Spirosoma endophyticum]
MSTRSTAHILLVEDEPKVASFIKKGLQTQTYVADVALTGTEGKRLFATNPYDLVILDINLPDFSGLDLAESIRRQDRKIPILMLTALDTTADKLLGFDAGADDYLAKPFDFMELLARVKALLRRSTASEDADRILRVADLELDRHERVARRRGQTIELTAREYALLEYLMRHAGRVVSRVDIAEQVWDIGFDTGTNVIDVYVSYLRAKIDKDSPTKLIHTLIGMGYVLKEK